MNLTITEKGARLAFIVGHYKAGSTWLLRLLSHHPDIRSLEETQIFRRAAHTRDLDACTRLLFASVPWSSGGLRNLPVYRARRLVRRLLQSGRARARVTGECLPGSLLDLPIREQKRLHGLLTTCATQDEYFQAFFAFMYDYYRPTGYLLEKTPMNIHGVPIIRSVFPDSKLIAIYRDGRDVVVSDKFYTARRNQEWSVEKSAERWRQAMQAQTEYADAYGIYTLSYEALHRDGRGEVRKIIEFLALPADEATISEMVTRSSFVATTGRRPGDERTDRFNRKGIVGDWRNHFTEEDKVLFKDIAGDMLVKFGFEHNMDW